MARHTMCVISNLKQYSQKMTPYKFYLHVPYVERVLAKRNGAAYDPSAKKWYVLSMTHMHCHKTIRRWHATSPKWRAYLQLRKEDTGQRAKTESCSWDPERRLWFVEVTGKDTLTPWHKDRLLFVEKM